MPLMLLSNALPISKVFRLGHLSTTDRERFALAQQSGVTVWQLMISNGTQLLFLQALHAPWSLLAAVSTQQADGSRA